MIDIILDLDQTLIYTYKRPLKHAEYSFKTKCGTVNVRPGFSELIRFLQTLNCRVHVFSAGTEPYVIDVCSMIFPPNLLSSIHHSKHCIEMSNMFQKILPDGLRSNKTIVLDDRVDVYTMYPNITKIRICPMDEHPDQSLKQVIHILRAEAVRLLVDM